MTTTPGWRWAMPERAGDRAPGPGPVDGSDRGAALSYLGPVATASPAALATALAAALRRAGVDVSPGQVQRLASAIGLTPPCMLDDLYWPARVTLICSVDDLASFDRLFAALAGLDLDPAEHRGDPNAPRMEPTAPRSRPTPTPAGLGRETGQSTRSAPAAGQSADDKTEDGSDDARPAALAVMSADERLGERDFAELTEDELRDLQALVQRLRLSTPLRRTRRARPQRSGQQVDMRRTLRRAGRSGGEPVRLHRLERREQRRRLVLLCDVSGSMEAYTRVFLGLLQGAVTGVRAEAFVFATRLTRVTEDLRMRDPDLALARASRSASDLAGGTRLGACLSTFLDTYGRRGIARGAVVVVISDGWTGDADVVADQMARLQRLAHRIVWVNPRKASPSYEPLAGGMAAGLPYCDAFVSGHSLRSLADVVAAVGTDQRRERP